MAVGGCGRLGFDTRAQDDGRVGAGIELDGSDGVDAFRLYQDGAPVPIADSGSNGNRTDSDASHDRILGRVNNGTYPFDGSIDEFMFFDTVLDDAEVAALNDCAPP